jgi:hypothetical protein
MGSINNLMLVHFFLTIIKVHRQSLVTLAVQILSVLSWLWLCIAHPIYLLEKRKTPTIEKEKNY